MAKFKVVQAYKDKELNKELQENEVVEMTVKRADEVENTLTEKGFDSQFLERIKEDSK